MGKHAYLIAAHSQFSLLQKLTTNKSKLKYVKRVKVNGGAYSQIKYELNLMKEALNTEAYDYVQILDKLSDEVYKQTIIWNSKYKENISEDEIRLIDWERGKPYTFKMEDYNELAGSKMLFARKFDENVDNDIIEKIWKGMKTL